MTTTSVTAGSGAPSAGVVVASDLAHPTFADVTIAALDSAGPDILDTMPFGIIGLDMSSVARAYNTFEMHLAGLSRESVLNTDFFLTTGVCMNNFLVAQRFEDEPDLDVTIDYVLTFRMRPTPAKLRLLQHPSARLHYILVHR